MVENSVEIPDTPERTHKDSESSDTEVDLHFSPIITLPEVPLVTHEEDEEEFLKIRAKLYRFDRKADPPEWKERGTGELKILRHIQNNSFRIVMRRDKTFKVCANHFVTPWMELKESSTNKKAFIYTVMADFADECSRSECLAVKFATLENANLFKSKFDESQQILKTDCDLYNGKVDAEIKKEIEKILEGAEDENPDEAKEISEKLSELEVGKETEKDSTEKKDE